MTLTPVPDYDPEFVQRVVELGREGLSRAEIAVRLSVGLRQFAVWAARHPEFDHALDLAETEALAWWRRLPREAVMKDNVFHPAVWAKAMALWTRTPVQRGPSDAKVARPRRQVIFEIPDNGRPLRKIPRPAGS
ncbi:MAG TPA: hypothetical protein VME40_15030 [Caulobacteraceae bacterium]|nr:hypothetical protein [Caulobacteraceae bacterium]